MEPLSISLEISVSAIQGKEMPEEAQLLEKILSLLYDHIIDDAAVVDAVHITKVNGKPTLEE
jgi:hypothetical protein